ncbi:MAG: methyltransferase regulatory domain-containing protein, partial [Deltaproteobacteria bacterium]|nr:methyltransferase regulatory domain-containing protein [Deltaproteobacteria bacterium]
MNTKDRTPVCIPMMSRRGVREVLKDPRMTIGYDEHPYPFLSYVETHPNRMATIGHLFGLEPVPLERCRVLELGCARGGNLIPMAYGLPEARFLGVDLSSRQIREAQEIAGALGLSNLSLSPMSIMDIDDSLGKFDYIIAHGVFSWVPREVQEKIFQVCRRHLSEGGIAFVSYNTYPGWHLKKVIRDAMLYHSRRAGGDSVNLTRTARAFLELAAGSVSPDNTLSPGLMPSYRALLEAGLEDVRSKEDAVLIHDELSGINDPLYFREFTERAAGHGLQYLYEADFPVRLYDRLPEKARKALEDAAPGIVDMEQYIDFLTARSFRRTLLCHEGVSLDCTIGPERVGSLYVSSRACPVTEDPDVLGNGPLEFQAPDESSFRTDGPLTKAAMFFLSEIGPVPVPFPELFSRARSLLGREKMPDK